jgi:multiple sugar transport system ATP-binding protein
MSYGPAKEAALCADPRAGRRRMASADVVDVRKSYGGVRVIHGVSISIPDGEFVTLVGPSGCGKSTLLRMIAGLEAIEQGKIRIGARVVNNLSPKDRDIAMVFQNYALYPHKTVAGNMSFRLKLRHVPKAEIQARVQRAAQILHVEPYLGRYPRQLSGGQRQRVAMGRAIVRDPQVFRIVVMRDGEVEQAGLPLDLYDRPGTLFVAGFIGSPAMNLFKGTVRVTGSPPL